MSPGAIARVALRNDEDVVRARTSARDIADLLGFDRQDQTRIATAVSELARNAHRYAHGGRVEFVATAEQLEIEVADDGPGIADVDEILAGRYGSSTGMGRGLLGVRRLMDAFEIESAPGRSTRVRIAKGLPRGAAAPHTGQVREALTIRRAVDPYSEVTRQNEELLLALGEVRARQDELLALDRELDDTNRGVVALYAELDDRAELLRDADERKSRFLADMSHELRTPLNSIIALTELLMGGEPPLETEQVTQVGFIRRMAEEQLKLVGDLLDIAKIEAGRIDLDVRPISMPELFSLLRAQLRPLADERGLELHLIAEPELPVLRTDEGKLVQILRNLISNAVKFTTEGTVTVHAERRDTMLCLRVIDTGIGIAKGDLARIFEEFVQVPGPQQEQGTGLGLPLSRKLAELLGGTLEVASEAGTGTTFTVSLPLERRPPGAEESMSPAGAVLVVDDDEASRYVVRMHLRESAWEVQEVSGGEAALAAIARGRPVAVVLDLSMPDLDGVEVLRRLRARDDSRDLPVIVHTSRLLDAGARAAIEDQGAVILDKSSTSRTTLITALSQLTGGSLAP